MCSGRTPGKSLLLVEDDSATRAALTVFLRQKGYAVSNASNGQDALDQLRGDFRPHLILLDLVMPGMDGWEFRRRQRQDSALAAIPVVVLSAAGAAGADAADLGDVGYLEKPVDGDALLAAVRRFTAPRKPEILVVEDDEAVRRMVELALQQHGFAVRAAAGGRQALELYRQHRGAIRLVLMDVQMPGLDGPQTLLALQQLDPQVRVVFMTGYLGKYTAPGLLALGALRVLHKPFGLTELTETLWQLVEPGG